MAAQQTLSSHFTSAVTDYKDPAFTRTDIMSYQRMSDGTARVIAESVYTFRVTLDSTGAFVRIEQPNFNSWEVCELDNEFAQRCADAAVEYVQTIR